MVWLFDIPSADGTITCPAFLRSAGVNLSRVEGRFGLSPIAVVFELTTSLLAWVVVTKSLSRWWDVY